MDGFLNAVQTVRVQADAQPEPSLKPIHTKGSNAPEEPGASKSKTQAINSTSKTPTEPIHIDTPQDILHFIRSQPETTALVALLRQLVSGAGFQPPFSLDTPGPNQAQIINAILKSVVPDFWPVFNDDDKELLAACLRNVTGANALVGLLRTLSNNTQNSGIKNESLESLADLLELADLVFRGNTFMLKIWTAISAAIPEPSKRKLAWKEIINLVGSGKVIATVAQVEDILYRSDSPRRSQAKWLARGHDYARWLAQNIASVSQVDTTKDRDAPKKNSEAGADILLKAFTLGYSTTLTKELMPALLQGDTATHHIASLFQALPSRGKRQLLEQILKWLSESTVYNEKTLRDGEGQTSEVSANASMVSVMLGVDETIKTYMIDFLVDPVLTNSLSLLVRRACIASIATVASDDLSTLLERTMATFGDQIFIKHAPIQQQECMAQTLLLTAGYLNRQTPMAVLLTARSMGHMQGISNRLDTSGQRARWLGMIVGTSLSILVDKEGSRMNFGTGDVRTDESKHFINLVRVEDKVGSISDFQSQLKARTHTSKTTTEKQKHRPKTEKLPIIGGKQTLGPARPHKPVQTEVIGERITEIDDDDVEDDTNGLKPYDKPDSDPEDSDDDATLVNRDKVKAPVYIRTLMTMLRDDQSHDRFQIAMKQAASLIRRKSSFGSEVKDHAEELMRILCNLQDPFDTDNFDELRLQAMIAVLLSDVESLGPWLSRQVFAGEYSLAQRCMMMSALGLGGRELAGLKNEDELNPLPANTEFPSKKLPPRLHAVYANAESSVKRLESASRSLEHQIIQPLALQAADESTAHLNALKVRTFSSRMAVERTKRKPAANRLAKLLGPMIFYPLMGCYQQNISAYGSGSVFSSAPLVLVTLLKTLALLLHAAGPATLNLPQITADYWDFLLSLRTQAVSEKSVLEALLFSLLTLMEINTDKRRLADDHAKQVMETQQWVEMVFERTADEDGGGSEEEAKVRALLAGVLVKTREVAEAYQKSVFGQVLQ